MNNDYSILVFNIYKYQTNNTDNIIVNIFDKHGIIN